ncbi:MAG: type II secretion system protein [Deltaproteobacteria bacterium]|nr:type II secretion system protein [Deltaproteobacteria bacterium]
MARRTVHTFISSRDAWFFGPDRSGFTYLSALILVAVMGIALGAAGRYWSTTVKREKEKELLFRGDQIRRAIESYYLSNPGSGGAKYPLSLAHLLKDPRYHDVRRHLRKLYRDPMTEDGEWGLIMDKTGGIKGVFSKSLEPPLKRGHFPSRYASFKEASSYADWKFIASPGNTRQTKEAARNEQKRHSFPFHFFSAFTGAYCSLQS